MPEILPYIIYAAIIAASTKHNIDPLLFIAIGLKEKAHYAWTDAVIGDLDAGMSVSPMQLNLDGGGSPPSGWTRQAWANELTKPEVWSEVAAEIIERNLKVFDGNVESAVAAYNRGINGTFDNYRGYVVPVMENYRRLQIEGFQIRGSADHDFQQYAPNTGEWREACVNLKGVCDDALEAGRKLAEVTRETAKELNALADSWGSR